METKINYNRCKTWQIGGFALNNASTNVWLFFMNFITYYATGFVGLSVMFISSLVMSMRIFDGITDPIIGVFMDRTNGKYGKFRPFMIAGNLVILLATFLMIFTSHKMSGSFQVLYFIFLYALYIIGYTMQSAGSKAGQSCLTNDPKQRPVFSLFDGVYVTLIFTVLPILVSNVLVPKHGGFTLEMFKEYWTVSALISFAAMCCGVIGIWKKDRTEYFGLGQTEQPKVKLSEFWDVMKNNRAIQMLTLAASSDKLATNISGNSTVLIMLFGIICGNYATYGQISGYTAIPQFIVLFLGIQVARKLGQKTALVWSTVLAIIFHAALFLIFVLGDPTKISLTNWNFVTVIFVLFYILMNASKNVATNIVMPMIPDCADYEVYRSGKYVPGMMSTLFSFIDKLISSLAATIVGASVAVIGFKASLPDESTPYSGQIFAVTAILYFGFPILGWICTLIAMKFYPLNDEMMNTVQSKISELKKEAA